MHALNVSLDSAAVKRQTGHNSHIWVPSRNSWKNAPSTGQTSALDTLRAGEYGRLDAEGHVYLDYTGGGLHAVSQIREHAELLNAHVFGNPHSAA